MAHKSGKAKSSYRSKPGHRKATRKASVRRKRVMRK